MNQHAKRPRAAHPRRGAGGFTLIEMMVAMTLGLLLTLGVCLTMLSMGQYFRMVGASSAAQVNAQVALSVINDSGRAAGAGLFNNRQPVCATFNAWSAGSVKSNGAALMPARIVDGGGNGISDRLVFTSATGVGPLSGLPVLDAMGSATASVVVSDGGLISNNDLALVGVPGSTTVPCTLFQVTAAPTTGTACGGNASQCKTLARVHVPNAGYNAPAGTYTTEPLYGYAAAGGVSGPAVVMRLGTEFKQQAFAVMCNTLVEYNAFSVNPSCTASPLSFGSNVNALATDVVLMQAQYGISNTSTSNVVTSWVSATGSWANPSVGDVQRIKAVRIVVISRAKEPDAAMVTAASCTNGASVVNTGPCNFEDAQAPVVDVSAVAVPSGRHWRQYRYRVQQAVIPLRNVIWSNG